MLETEAMRFLENVNGLWSMIATENEFKMAE